MLGGNLGSLLYGNVSVMSLYIAWACFRNDIGVQHRHRSTCPLPMSDQHCLSLTTLVCISPSFVCRGQYYLVRLTVLSVMNNNGWYISQFSLSWTCRVIDLYISQFFSVTDTIGWYINWFCLS